MIIFVYYITIRLIKFQRNTTIGINNKKGTFEKEKNINYKSCYLSPEISNIKFKHLIITRFMMELNIKNYNEKIYTDNYIQNSIRVLNKYLLPSLGNQTCKDFTWILKIGDKANKSLIYSLLSFNSTFKFEIIYEKDIKNYIENISKDLDVLITTRIDYDDCIYKEAVNDVRKQIDINKPILLHGYNKGVYYFETENKYFDYFNTFDNRGAMSIFLSLIINLHKVNDTINIYDLGDHTYIKKTLLKQLQSYGIKEINYDPGVFDTSSQKFVWVRQGYSGSIDFDMKILKISRPIEFDLSKIFGK